MLSNIWVGVTGGTNSVARFRSSGCFAQRRGRLFRVGTCAVNASSLFARRLFAIRDDCEGPRHNNPLVRQSFIFESGDGSLPLEKARMIRYRANVGSNG
jgi:fluoride ion exporter CrcB/FEX